MTKLPKLRSKFTEQINKKIRELVMLQKHEQFHKYLTNIYKNLVVGSFEPAEQHYLGIFYLFSLKKVFKLRLECKIQIAFSIITKKIHNFTTIQASLMKINM